MKIPEEIRKEFFKVYKIIKLKENLFGTSPPSIFVSSKSYPITNIGILTNYKEDERSYILDYPELWYKERLDEISILKLRANLVYSFTKENVYSKNKLLEKFQEITLSKRPIDVELKIKKPSFKITFFKFSRPIGNPTLIQEVRIVDNVSAEKIVEDLINENIKAREAVIELYTKNLEISRIEKIFSAGLIGKYSERKLVPTRWSITAVDSIISDFLVKQIREFEFIEKPMLLYNEYLNNEYYIFLLPYSFIYEIFEVYNKNIYHDFEGLFGRKDYPENVAGGYYAAKLGICEYLYKIKKQAAVIIYRKIKSSLAASLGVWKVREAVKDAKLIKIFENVKEFEEELKKLDIEAFKKSFVLNFIKKQRNFKVFK